MVASGRVVLACTTCRQAVRDAIYDEQFLSNVGMTLLPVLVVAAFAALVYRLGRPGGAALDPAPVEEPSATAGREEAHHG